MKRFCKLSCSGGDSRWQVDPSWDYDITDQLGRGVPLAWPSVGPVVNCLRPDVIEDMPWSLDSSLIISRVLRTFLERYVPNSVQYLPVTMVANDTILDRAYYVMNILQVWDCMDRPRSYDEDEDGPFVEQLVIDPLKIPEDGMIGIVQDYSIPLICDELRDEIERSGFIGPQFYDVWHSSDEGAPLPIWCPGRSRR